MNTPIEVNVYDGREPMRAHALAPLRMTDVEFAAMLDALGAGPGNHLESMVEAARSCEVSSGIALLYTDGGSIIEGGRLDRVPSA